MPQEKKPRFTLGTVDDMFTTQEMRDDAKLARIHEIPLDEIDAFPEHPYKVKDDEDMMNLVESIRENGVLTPATVRKKKEGWRRGRAPLRFPAPSRMGMAGHVPLSGLPRSVSGGSVVPGHVAG